MSVATWINNESKGANVMKAGSREESRSRTFQRFIFATGIENSYPTVMLPSGERFRVDEMEKTGHYKRWREDFALVRELGIQFLRYGPPYYRTHLGPGRYDWSFADATFNALDELGIEPIADLCHFGVPDWVGNFQNPDFPRIFAEYAGAFAQRFPSVRLFTPINEIFITATFSAQYGWWNECLASDQTFVRALNNICRANILAERAIINFQPNAVFIQSESSEYFHAEGPSCMKQADFLNDKRFLSLDLTYGHSLNVQMYQYLLDNGLTREDYAWFKENHLKTRSVMGTDYYITNEHIVHANGMTSPAGDVFGYYVITKQYYKRYRLPVMHTETNLTESAGAVDWLRKQWANMHMLKKDGVPILGFTWYSLTDQVDWDTALREDNGNVNAVGLVDLDRKIRPVGQCYRTLIEQWRDILPTESSSLSLCY
jgi:beta-glucosidase/6-phospho-beta-glucosidase/beta-galactosidase